jgi:hypothetical protein
MELPSNDTDDVPVHRLLLEPLKPRSPVTARRVHERLSELLPFPAAG